MLWNLAKVQATRSDLKVHAILLNDGRLAGLLREEGLQVRIVHERGRTLWSLLKAIDQALREIAPTIIHTHRYKENLLSYLLAWRHRAISVVTLHGYEPSSNPLVRVKFGLLRAISYRIAWLVGAHFVAVSEDLRALLRRSPKRCVVIPNGIPIPDESPRTEAIADEAMSHAPVIGWVGRMVRVKGLATLLDALAVMGSSPIRPRLLLVGDGPERAALERHAERLGIHSLIEFTGHVDDPSPCFQRMDVFAFPSLHEGVPIALLEAMAHCVPAVAASVGGIPELIGGTETVRLLESRSPKVWAAAIREVLNNPEQARLMAERGRRLVQGRFSVETMVERYMEVYRAATCLTIRPAVGVGCEIE